MSNARRGHEEKTEKQMGKAGKWNMRQIVRLTIKDSTSGIITWFAKHT
jgi:hypothetical protein